MKTLEKTAMIYGIKIIPSPVTNERVLHFDPMPSEEDLPTLRGARLAQALRARYIPLYRGYSMIPSRLARWQLLYDAGYDAYRRTGETYGWRVFLDGKTAVPIARALKSIRRAKEAVAV